MNWHETIAHIRSTKDYDELVNAAYLGGDIHANVKRYAGSEEFKEILKKIRELHPSATHILDIGSGNGISAAAFSMNGYKVTALEPDPSDSIGAGAIRILKNDLNIHNLEVIENTAENFNSEIEFDIIFARQALHHATELDSFVLNCAKHLKVGGLFIAIRDHVLSEEKDLSAFLESHPLQKFYGGENAFTLNRYETAFTKARLKVIEEIGPLSSVINFHPRTEEDVSLAVKQALASKGLGFISNNTWVQTVTRKYLDTLDKTPGRLYSFITLKEEHS